MNNILLALVYLMVFISCHNHDKNNSEKSVTIGSAKSSQIQFQQFIPQMDPVLNENSGLIFYDNLLWTFNDSGGENKIYGVDFSGNIKKEIELTGAVNIDWEEITQDEMHIYIGDFGNNNGARKNLKIYRINKNDINQNPKQEIDWELIQFEYANQKNFGYPPLTTPFDCEAMAELNDTLFLFSKDWEKLTTTVYKVLKNAGFFKLNPVDSFNVQGVITGADISPDKKKLALIGYNNFKPLLWVFSEISAGNIFGKENQFFEFDSLQYAQTEGICFLGNDSLLISCEQTSAFDHQVLLIDLKNQDKQ
jgi:hypothetical protein